MDHSMRKLRLIFKRKTFRLLLLCGLTLSISYHFYVSLRLVVPRREDSSHQAKNNALMNEESIPTSDYAISVGDVCKNNSSVDLVDHLVMIHSSPNGIRRRNAIRETWSAEIKNVSRSVTIFLLGTTNDLHLQTAIESEARLHADILQGTFVDSYQNLTLKSVMMLKWAFEYCSKARFLLKMDDDTYVNVPNLVKALKEQSGDAVYGHHNTLSFPVRIPGHKWFVSKQEYSETVYPQYVSGSGYVIGGKIIPLIYRTSLETKLFKMEDIYVTGMCRIKAGVKIVHIRGFNFLNVGSLCALTTAVTSTDVGAEEMRHSWHELHHSKVKCT